MKYFKSVFSKINNKEYVHYNYKNQIHVFTENIIDSCVEYEVVFRLTRKCNHNCAYCFINHKEDDLDCNVFLKFMKMFSLLHRTDNIRFTISGGEPSISPIFTRIISKIKKYKVKIIEIQTNATVFSNNYFYEKNNLPSIQYYVSLPSAHEKLFNKITKTKNYKFAIDGIKNLSKNNYVMLNYLITRYNYFDIVYTTNFINEFFNDNVFLNFSYVSSLEFEKIKDFLVDYYLVVDEFKKINQKLWKKKIAVMGGYRNKITIHYTGCTGFPYCIIKDIINEEMDKFVLLNHDVSYNDFSKNFYKNDLCKKCSYNSYCNGFLSSYIKKFGDSQIKPL